MVPDRSLQLAGDNYNSRLQIDVVGQLFALRLSWVRCWPGHPSNLQPLACSRRYLSEPT